MTDDSLADDTGFQTLPTDEINYMRNAVKATVDAYDGTVTLYAWDEEDPILKAWSEVFPDVVQPRDDIPEALLEHLRYPEDLFKVQRYQFARYHVTDAKDFYEDNNPLGGPDGPARREHACSRRTGCSLDDDRGQLLPRRSTCRATGQPGRLRVGRQRRDRRGLRQDLGARAAQRAHRRTRPGRQRDQLGRGRARGAAQVHPGRRRPGLRQPADAAGRRRADVRPAAVRRARTPSRRFPILRFVLVSYGDEVGIGTTLREAIVDVLGRLGDRPDARRPSPCTEIPDGGAAGAHPEPEPSGSVNDQIRALLAEAEAKFAAADRAQANGNSVGWARLMEQGRDLITAGRRSSRSAGDG